MLLLSATSPRTSDRRENSVRTKIWVNLSKDQILHLVHWWNTSQIPRETKARIPQFGKKVLSGIFLGYALLAGGIWKGDILVADIEELEKLDASEIYPRRLNAIEVLISHKDGEFVFLVADGSATLSGRDDEVQQPTLRREHTVRRENLSGESQGDREESHSEETKDEAETQEDFWSIQGDFIHRHHIEPRVQLYVPKEESFPIPLKYIDVIRSTHTDLDVAQEKRIDDNWNVDGDRNLSDSWTGFTRFTLLNETPPEGYMWSGGRLTKIQTTSRPDHIWPDAWTRIGKAAQKREKKNGQSRNRNSNTPENWEEFILLIRVMKSTKASLTMQGESWRHQRQLQCPVEERFLKHPYGKPFFKNRKIQGIWSKDQIQLYH